MTYTLQNKQIIIAGGTSGIGLATARALTAQGASVTVTGRNEDRLKAAAGLSIQSVRLDSTDRPGMDRFFGESGGFDHLVVALGSRRGLGNFSEASLDDFRQGFEEKYWAHLHTVQAALPYLREGGSITLVTAISAVAKMPGTSGIGSANGALEIMVPIWAKEMPQFRINAVSPGIIDTPWWDFLPEEARQQAFTQYAAQIPVGRVGQPEDVASVVLFLLCHGYMTGKVIACDGGLS